MSDFMYMICTLGPSITIGVYKMYLAFSLLGKYGISIEESKTHKQYRDRLKRVDRVLYVSIAYMFCMFFLYRKIMGIL